MSSSSQQGIVSTWLAPKTIMQVGIPTAIAIFLLLVMTGIIPTPLMSGLQTINSVSAEHENMVPILDEILYLDRVKCLRDSTTPEMRTECYTRRHGP